MEQKEQGAHSLHLKLFLVLISTCFIVHNSWAQNEQFDFKMNLVRTIHYPDILKQSCTPAFTNLLIDISENGTITDIFISDSAPQTLKDEFDTQKSKLNIQIFESYVARNKLKNCGLLIPLFYVFGSDYCTNSFNTFISKRYLMFNFKYYDKLTRVLEPIVDSFSKPVQ